MSHSLRGNCLLVNGSGSRLRRRCIALAWKGVVSRYRSGPCRTELLAAVFVLAVSRLLLVQSAMLREYPARADLPPTCRVRHEHQRRRQEQRYRHNCHCRLLATLQERLGRGMPCCSALSARRGRAYSFREPLLCEGGARRPSCRGSNAAEWRWKWRDSSGGGGRCEVAWCGSSSCELQFVTASAQATAIPLSEQA